MKRTTKFEERIDVRMTKKQQKKLTEKADIKQITPNQLIRDLIDLYC